MFPGTDENPTDADRIWIEEVFPDPVTDAQRSAFVRGLERYPEHAHADRAQRLTLVKNYVHALLGGSAYTTRESARVADDNRHDDDQPLPWSELPMLPDGAWRGPFAHYRAAMDGTTEATDAVHFACLWAAAAARLRRRVFFAYPTALYPNPYLVIVGGTGEAKTSGMRLASDLFPTDRVKVQRGAGSAEALGDWMTQDEDAAPRAHLLVLEEIATLLIRGKWEGNTLIPFLTETFDTPPLFEIPYRKNPVRVVEPTPMLLAGTTPEWFWQSMKELDFHGGFGNRIFYLAGTPKAPIPIPGAPDIAKLLEVKRALDDLDKVPAGEMTLAPEAQAVWNRFYIAWKTTRVDPLLAAATKRLPAYALKAGLVYAAFERTAPTITREQITAAILVARYGMASAEWLIAQRRGYSKQGGCEEALLRALERTDLPAWQVHQRIGGRFSAEELQRAIRALLATHAVLEVGRTKRGEPIYGLRGRRRGA